MNQARGKKSALVRLEYLFWSVGVACLISFILARASIQANSSAGVAAFEQARAEVQEALPDSLVGDQVTEESAELAPGPGPVTVSGSAVTGDLVPEPDFTDWSEKRIAEYKESVAASSDYPLAVLSIHALNIKVPVYNGASDLNLNRGVARIRGTARIGEESNLGIAGHRDGFFRGLQDISVGDRIFLDTMAGQTRYRVTRIRIVNPDEVHVLDPTDSSTLTLVTCYPFYFVGSAPQRYIVTAEAENV